jgi:hypothetical protein
MTGVAVRDALHGKVCVDFRAGEARADTVVASIRASGGTAISVRADVSVESEAERLFTEVDVRLGMCP